MLHQQQQQQQQQQKPKFRLQLEDVGNPQPCPDNPIRLLASRTPQYIYSPYDENKLYPPDTDCQFLIEATDKFHRIHLTIIESDLEEALFTDCNDYVSVRDREGNETSIKEVARWCGQDYPAAIASASDSLLVHFHSDSIIQKRGFNISFVQFDIDTCPPDWISDGISSPYCYKQFVLPHILPWYEAQKECNFERANLATFQNEADYAFIVESYSQTHSFPWVGYSDANVEGIYESIDRNVPLWPENFPLKHENEMKDCVYLDWNKRDQIVVYEIDDCRNRRPFLCKKRRDGTEVPVILPAGMIRRGFRDFTMDYTLLVVVVIFALLALVVGCVLFHKYKERNNQIINIDMNQRLVQQQQGQQPGNKDKAAAALARQKAKERERRELREQKYAETSNNNSNRGGGRGGGGGIAATTKSPFESQDSNASFPLQTFQSTFAQRMTSTTTGNVEPLDTAAALAEASATASQQMREHEATKLHPQQLSAEIVSVDSPPEDDLNSSPRIRMSPNQPSFVEEGRKISEKKIRKGWMGAGVSGGGTTDREEEEEEKDRHNMGYEPDSEEEEHEENERQKIRRASKINGEGEGGEENFLMELNDEGGRKNTGENIGENIGENEELEQYTQHNHMEEELEQYSGGGEQFKQYKHKNVIESEQYINSQQFKQLESDDGVQQTVVQVELHGENGEEGGLGQFKDKRTKEERINNFDEKMMDSYAIGDHFKAAKVATSAIASAAAIAATEHPIRPPIELMRTRTTSTDKAKSPPPPKEAKESEKIGESGKSSREATREGKEETREEKETFPEKVSGKVNISSSTATNIVKTEGEGTGTRIRIKRKTFDRPPPVGPLDNVSAISLDEFWQQQK
uniref:CUB domain-containing protein n=1 Tax=Meloidogyne incognita TaxID=6306 RepID=A0A914MAN4_MELIC